MYGLYHNVSFNLQTTSTLSAASEQQSFLCKVYNWSNLKMPRLQVIIKVDNRVTPPAPYSITVAGMERQEWWTADKQQRGCKPLSCQIVMHPSSGTIIILLGKASRFHLMSFTCYWMFITNIWFVSLIWTLSSYIIWLCTVHSLAAFCKVLYNL